MIERLKAYAIRIGQAAVYIVTPIPTRENASAAGPITTINNILYDNITAQWGANQTFNSSPNFANIIYYALHSYPSIMGQIAWVVIFSIPFLMMWFMQADMTLPGIVGILIGGYLLLRMPEQYLFVSVAFITIAAAAAIWSLIHKRT